MKSISKEIDVTTTGLIGYIACAALIISLPTFIGQDDAVAIYLTVAGTAVGLFVADVARCLASARRS